MEFYGFWKAAKPSKQFSNRYRVTERAWNTRSEAAQQAMMKEMIAKGGLNPARNPYFYVIDYKDPEPCNWNGRALDKSRQYVTAKWNGKWGMYTVEDAKEFGMMICQRH